MSRIFLAILFKLVLSAAADDDWRSSTKHVVLLVEENRSFDNFCGGFSYNAQIDGLLHRKFCNPANFTDLKDKTIICAELTEPNVEPDDPNHSISGVNMQPYGTFHPDEEAIKAGNVHATIGDFLAKPGLYHLGDLSWTR
jgi:phospholipase C